MRSFTSFQIVTTVNIFVRKGTMDGTVQVMD
jgi:hypothetical protein